MAMHRLSRESLGIINLENGRVEHKFITTPRRIFFGDDGEFHQDLLKLWEEQDPELVAEEKEMLVSQALRSCPHDDAVRLAVVDAGLMVVEGVVLPETVAFEQRSREYGMGDRQRTQMIAGFALRGSWKLHLPQQE